MILCTLSFSYLFFFSKFAKRKNPSQRIFAYIKSKVIYVFRQHFCEYCINKNEFERHLNKINQFQPFSFCDLLSDMT